MGSIHGFEGSGTKVMCRRRSSSGFRAGSPLRFAQDLRRVRSPSNGTVRLVRGRASSYDPPATGEGGTYRGARTPTILRSDRSRLSDRPLPKRNDLTAIPVSADEGGTAAGRGLARRAPRAWAHPRRRHFPRRCFLHVSIGGGVTAPRYTACRGLYLAQKHPSAGTLVTQEPS